MFKVELVPDLTHCIETVAKRQYQEAVQRLLSAEEVSDKLKEKAEILRLFLQVADFRKLRAESEAYLLRGKSVSFTVYLEGSVLRYETRTTP
jgi:hypothetical protein